METTGAARSAARDRFVRTILVVPFPSRSVKRLDWTT
jgi:hypothetical protein